MKAMKNIEKGEDESKAARVSARLPQTTSHFWLPIWGLEAFLENPIGTPILQFMVSNQSGTVQIPPVAVPGLENGQNWLP